MSTAEVRDPASPADVLSLGEAEERLLVSSGVVNRAMAEVVATVAEMMSQGDAWLGWGYTSVN
ncbi:MAG: hypothetical protein Q4G43_11095, partial [Mobilicoccus sp.]|nr:hypothetical protein [Mobilicoccus sp.]